MLQIFFPHQIKLHSIFWADFQLIEIAVILYKDFLVKAEFLIKSPVCLTIYYLDLQ